MSAQSFRKEPKVCKKTIYKKNLFSCDFCLLESDVDRC